MRQRASAVGAGSRAAARAGTGGRKRVEPAMPIGFRCTGCRARLHVPARWQGNTIPCPRCGCRVVVPQGQPDGESPFEDRGVERSLAALDPPSAESRGGVFSEETFTLPPRDAADAADRADAAWAGQVTLPRGAIYAYAMALPIVAIVAFGLGCWWTMLTSR